MRKIDGKIGRQLDKLKDVDERHFEYINLGCAI